MAGKPKKIKAHPPRRFHPRFLPGLRGCFLEREKMTNEQLGRVIQNAYNEGYEKAMGDTQSRARKAAEEIVKSFAMVENIGWEKLAENIIARHFSEGEE